MMCDVIRLDNHRLLCGDATCKEDVDKLLDGVKVDLLITDPPYGIDIVKIGGGKSADKVAVPLDHSERERETTRHNRWSKTSNIQEEQWEYQQDQGSPQGERERLGKVGKPRRCRTKTLQTSNR